MNRWTSRKFWVAVGVFATGTILLIMGKIDMAVWQWVSGSSIVAYLGSQGIADAVASFKK